MLWIKTLIISDTRKLNNSVRMRRNEKSFLKSVQSRNGKTKHSRKYEKWDAQSALEKKIRLLKYRVLRWIRIMRRKQRLLTIESHLEPRKFTPQFTKAFQNQSNVTNRLSSQIRVKKTKRNKSKRNQLKWFSLALKVVLISRDDEYRYYIAHVRNPAHYTLFLIHSWISQGEH